MPARAPLRRILLPVMLGSLIGLLAAAAVLFSAWQQQQHVQRQLQATLLVDSLQQVLVQELQQLARLGERLATDLPPLISATRTDLDLVARQHRLASLRLLPARELAVDPQASVPINYGVLDLLRRTLRDGSAPAEAYRIDGQWLLYATALQRDVAGQPIAVLLLVRPLEQLLERLPLPDPQLGELRLLQAYTDDEPQVLLQRGQGAGEALQWSTRHPGWLLQFRPGPQLQPVSVDWIALMLAVLACLGGSLLGALLAIRLQPHDSHCDQVLPPRLSVPSLPPVARQPARPAASGDEVFDLSDGA